jgi:plasmid maintenance system antidote protein VapI/Zn-dependent peptidase ImmA (M78 family)
MADAHTFRPNWSSAPGDTISDLLEERGVAPQALAKDIGLSADDTDALLEGRLPVSPEIASRLEGAFGVPASFWMARERSYRRVLATAIGTGGGATATEWLRHLPTRDMVQFGWVEPEPEETLFDACLRFFGTPDLETWRAAYRDILSAARFRKSPTYASDPGAVAAWMRQGELSTSSLLCAPWNPIRFEAVLSEIRPLTRKKHPRDFVPELVRRAAECGVGVAVVRAPHGCRASGATRFVSRQRALLLLSFRYLTDDQFWFTFFHEAAHLLLHGERAVFLEGTEGDASPTREENEANAFAANLLIPPKAQEYMRLSRTSHIDVIRLARRLGISPGIVVGQLQHAGRIPRSHLNRLKRRYSWE